MAHRVGYQLARQQSGRVGQVFDLHLVAHLANDRPCVRRRHCRLHEVSLVPVTHKGNPAFPPGRSLFSLVISVYPEVDGHSPDLGESLLSVRSGPWAAQTDETQLEVPRTGSARPGTGGVAVRHEALVAAVRAVEGDRTLPRRPG